MKITSIVAIYTLFWSLSFFFVLPFRLRSSAEPDPLVPGQADSAPPRFSFKRTCLWTTIVSVVLCTVYYLNYIHQWVVPDQIDFFTRSRGR